LAGAAQNHHGANKGRDLENGYVGTDLAGVFACKEKAYNRESAWSGG
jgi:hypothetical protein